jgi:hypothetical protein
MFLFYFYVPEDSKEIVKNALFEKVGAGRWKNYSHCSFETLGLGQFLPLSGANPYMGDIGKIEKVVEYKVEMIIPKNLKDEVVQVLKSVHPYEEVAYGFLDIHF